MISSGKRKTTQRILTELQERFLKSGIEGLDKKEIVRLLISTGIPCEGCREDLLSPDCQECQAARKRIVEKLKDVSLRELMSASPKKLEQMGVPKFGIFCIKLLTDLPNLLLKEKVIKKHIYNSSREIFEYLSYSMQNIANEILKILYLDSKNKIIAIEDMFKGTLDSIHISP